MLQILCSASFYSMNQPLPRLSHSDGEKDNTNHNDAEPRRNYRRFDTQFFVADTTDDSLVKAVTVKLCPS